MIYSDFNGRLGADSELATFKNGNKYVAMRVASNDYSNGENVTTWINVKWSGDRAIKMQEYMKKGTFVNVHGALRVSMYSTKSGEKAISVDVYADRVDFVGGGSGNTQSNDAVTETGTFKNAANTEKLTKEAETKAEVKAAASSDVDDLPF